LPKLGSLMRSHATNGTPWNCSTIVRMNVRCRSIAWGSKYALAPPKTSGRKAKKVTWRGRPVLARGHQIRLERAERALVRAALAIGELVPRRPPARAHHVHAGARHLGEVRVPHGGVGVLEEEALHVARHERGAHDGERLAVELEVALVRGEAAGRSSSSRESRIQKPERWTARSLPSASSRASTTWRPLPAARSFTGRRAGTATVISREAPSPATRISAISLSPVPRQWTSSSTSSPPT
jgi:hypothetical protein